MHALETLSGALTMSFEWIWPLAEDLADAPLTSPTPAGGNHPLWIMGHVVHSRAGLMALIHGGPNPVEAWGEMFRGGTRPVPRLDAYPRYEEILRTYQQTHEETLRLLKKVGEAGLDEKPQTVPERLQDDPSFQTKGRLFQFIALHEMSHRGQLADARQVLGRTPFA